MNPMNQANQMNPMNQANQMNPMNQANQMNPINRANPMQQMKQMQPTNQMQAMNSRQPLIEYVEVPAKKNNTVDYIIMPIILIILFVFLVHPKTSKIIGKYLPQPRSLLGLVSRGLVLAVAYVIIRFLFNMIGI
ncbi:hypothetical protein [Bandra megavirus]|uniref:Uncharacterized protein n=1 Tax=Bandra megavirus TaxID=2071566 RepID=A0A2K9V8H8_9VIRU|nr:hypothetical protein [Bandra megavirus]